MAVRVHIHLSVKDIDASRRFYQKFFGVMPVKVKPGYTKFLPEVAPVNLALFGNGSDLNSLNSPTHLGIQLDSTKEVHRYLDRVIEAGLPVREEMGVTCCHANQDKFWVEDPDGTEWEVYNVNFDIDGDEIDLSSPVHNEKERVAIPLNQSPQGPCCGS